MGYLIKRAGTVPYCRRCDNTLRSLNLSSPDFNLVKISQEFDNFWLLTLILLIFGSGCSSDIQNDKAPVASVDLSLRRSNLSIGGPVSMTIDFGVLRDIETAGKRSTGLDSLRRFNRQFDVGRRPHSRSSAR